MIIESNILPPVASGRGRPAVWPFGGMIVGESFLVESGLRAASARACAAQYKRLHPGWDYASRREGDGLRIWRTA